MRDALPPTLVFLTHGVADTAVTFGVFAATESTEVESNPLLREALRSALLRAAEAGDPIGPHLLPAAVGKLSAVLLAVLLLWWFRESVPGWRPFCYLLALAGAVVVGNNLLALA